MTANTISSALVLSSEALRLDVLMEILSPSLTVMPLLSTAMLALRELRTLISKVSWWRRWVPSVSTKTKLSLWV